MPDAATASATLAVSGLDRHDNRAFRADVGHLHVHAGLSFSARLTNASMNVFAMWLNTGPTMASRRCVVNS